MTCYTGSLKDNDSSVMQRGINCVWFHVRPFASLRRASAVLAGRLLHNLNEKALYDLSALRNHCVWQTHAVMS